MKRFVLPFLIGAVSSAMPNAGRANDEALYGAPVPGDAVFIRWLGDASRTAMTVLDHQFSRADIKGETYVAISSAALTGAEPGDYFSVVLDAAGHVRVIEEPGRDDKSKVHLILLNAGPVPVSMTLPGGDRTVIGETKPGASNTRAVNPVSARLAVGTDAFDVTLRRGQNLTFAVLDGEVRVIENSFGPVVSVE